MQHNSDGINRSEAFLDPRGLSPGGSETTTEDGLEDMLIRGANYITLGAL